MRIRSVKITRKCVSSCSTTSTFIFHWASLARAC